jgi:hypothetical protein
MRGGLVVSVRRELRACQLQFSFDPSALPVAQVKAGQFGAQHLDMVV